jgi:ligand-binding sensor domain-containing protein/serine phosphatase RsbU (regulator of sigma subunit)
LLFNTIKSEQLLTSKMKKIKPRLIFSVHIKSCIYEHGNHKIFYLSVLDLNNVSKRFKHITFLLLLSLSVTAQKLKFKHLTTDNGLSTNLVNCIMQDSEGFMWFGTQDGLNKYDGYSFKTYRRDPENQNSLSSSDVTALLQFNEELMFIGTKDGLNVLDIKTNKVSRIKLLSTSDAISVNRIVKLNDSEILLTTNKSIFKYKLNASTSQQIKFPFEEEVEAFGVLELDGKVLIGTVEKGLWSLDKNGLKRIGFKNDFFPDFDINVLNNIHDIKIYANHLYIGTYGGGVVKVDKSSFEIESLIMFIMEKNNDANYINSLSIEGNKLFAATKSGFGVYNLLNGAIELITKKENGKDTELNDNDINDVWKDKENNLWLATQFGGVNIYFAQTQKFPNDPFYRQEEFQNLYVVQQDNQKNIWLGGDRKLVMIENMTGKLRDYSDIISNKDALCFFQEDENTFYVGTYGIGVIKFDKRTKTAKKIFPDKVGGTVMSMVKDSYNNLLIGTFDDGLFKYNLKTGQLNRYYPQNGFNVSTVFSIFEARDKSIWIGTNREGAIHLKGFETDKMKVISKYINTNNGNQISSNTVYSINESIDKSIWFATESGLSKLDKNNIFSNYYEKDGLNSGYLYSILKDSSNHFWVSSNKGLIKFDPNYKDKKPIFKNYELKDGIINKEHNQNAFSVARDGRMFFGGGIGYNTFMPKDIKDNYHIPFIQIVSYKRGGKDVETDSLITYKKQLQLSWRENYFQFEVAALDYTDPNKNLYSYKLEGYDENWSEPSNIRYISYTELPGGDYTLKIKASNNDGIWNETPLALKITVVPPFWKTKWFFVLLIIFGAGGVYAFTQYRTQAVKRENKVLETKVAERTKELEEKNRDITSSIEYAKRIQEAILPARDYIFDRLKKAFILYKPKDIVSGDFYWFAEKDGFKIFAVVDCTGHGVPGAFMSMIGHNLLHQIVLEKGFTDPAVILGALHKGVQEALRQGHNEISTNDGMDVSLISINHEQKLFKWAGANRPLILINDSEEFSKIEGNKFPIGGAQLDVNRVFTSHTIPSHRPMIAYMFSDGYADQFGGDKGKKYMVKRFHELLQQNHKKDMAAQRLELDKSFEQWRGNHEQVDDVLVVGIGI